MTPVERFWSKVNKTDGCWLWTGTIYSINKYGCFVLMKKKHPAHRYSYELVHGPVPKHLDVCHACDVPLCVRPDHLWVGTRSENLRDAGRKGRTKNQRHPELVDRGEDCRFAKLRTPQVLEMRELFAGGASIPDLAERYSVARNTVRWVVTGKSWRHLLPKGGNE